MTPLPPLDAPHDGPPVLAQPDPWQRRNDLRSKLENDLLDALEERTGDRETALAVLDVALIRHLASLEPEEALRIGTHPGAVRWVEEAAEAHRLADIASRS